MKLRIVAAAVAGFLVCLVGVAGLDALQFARNLWSCTGPTTFEWQFAADETVHLLEGEVKVDYLGKSFTLRPGDTATFHAKTASTWTIDTFAKKVYTLHNLPRGGDVMRRVAPVVG